MSSFPLNLDSDSFTYTVACSFLVWAPGFKLCESAQAQIRIVGLSLSLPNEGVRLLSLVTPGRHQDKHDGKLSLIIAPN